MKPFRILLCLAALLLLVAGAFCEGENLLVNGDFSETDGELPAGWRKEMWYTDTGISKLSLDENGYDGNCVVVTNVDENDARFAQTVTVTPDTLYRISAMVKAEGCDPNGIGATLSIGSIFCYSEALYDTDGEWVPLTLYGRTGEDQTTLDLFIRVGGYGYETVGTAWFDQVEMVEIDEIPEGEVENIFYADTEVEQTEDESETEPSRNTEAWLLLICLYMLAMLSYARKCNRTHESAPAVYLHGLIAVLIVAFAVRLVLAVRIRGYYTDINCFSGWSARIFSTGILGFYSPDAFCDYPPLYMLLLYPVELLRRLLGLSMNGSAYQILLKMLPILCDLVGALFIWNIGKNRVGSRAALLLAAFYAFNPAALVDSAAWGQIDSILTLLVVLCAWNALEGNTVSALVWFAFAMLVKPQALLFAPVGLAAILIQIICSEPERRAYRIRRFLIGIAAALGILYVFAFLFTVKGTAIEGNVLTRPVAWLIDLYGNSMSGYKYLVVNALNVYDLLGYNWAHAELHPILYTVQWILFAACYVYAVALLIASRKKPKRLLLVGATLIILIFNFGPMIHERYIFPALLLLAAAYICDRDKRLLIVLVTLTGTLFMNEVLVLQGGMTSANYGHLQSSEQWLNGLLSAINLLIAVFTAWTAFDICVHNRVYRLSAPIKETEPIAMHSLCTPEDHKLHFNRIDALLIASVTLVYSLLTFVNLGTTKAPQSGWTSSISEETVVFDLGETQTFRMTYYGGICNSNFTVRLSDDGEHWSEACYAVYDQGEIFRWIWYVPSDASGTTLYAADSEGDASAPSVCYASSDEPYPMQTARYVSITAQSAGLVLYEVGFLDASGEALPVHGVSCEGQTEGGSNPAFLIDEQDTVAAYPSYYNSSYFDEIYHARTAFEHLNGMSTYEWTHPPLGKVTMMLGIKLFGMTPFGWRFMGALFGVLMLPLMYLLVKQLTKDSKLSLIAMALLALDSMHFTQTRIATIDSYAVFWIMLMYLFMIRYTQMSWNHVSLRRTLVPLGLCGITMGIAWATKWIAIYASAGLAIMFFLTIYRRFRENIAEPSKCFRRNLIVTLSFCIVFFIFVPLCIYYFSYYWHLRGEGLTAFSEMFSLNRVKRVWEIQKNIFNYHTGLSGDTHYFRSPWYQWPVIYWPMWYYSGTAYMPEGYISSISCMGNPAVWWFGLVALVYVLVRACWKRRTDKTDLTVLIGFASQFMPWVLVPRSTFIYHYFASVPFIIMASVLMLRDLRNRHEKAFTIAAAVLLALAAVLFIGFYPLESGLPCARSYAKLLRWFKWYNY